MLLVLDVLDVRAPAVIPGTQREVNVKRNAEKIRQQQATLQENKTAQNTAGNIGRQKTENKALIVRVSRLLLRLGCVGYVIPFKEAAIKVRLCRHFGVTGHYHG